MSGGALKLWITAGLLVGTLIARPAGAAPGDTCAEATEIAALPFSSSGSTCGAGNDFINAAGGGAVCTDLPQGYGGDDVFFKLKLEQGNQVAFDLALPPGSTGDLALFLVRAPSCSDPQVCAANSVDLIGAGVGPERIKANTQAYPSGTYYLIVDSKLSAPDPASCGAYALTVTGHLSAFCGNGTVDPGEVCDDGNAKDGDCCSADCHTKASTSTVCRAAPEDCDVAETCNADGTCPADSVRPAGSSCRMAAGDCDLPEVCDGVRPSCPADRLKIAGTVCRPANGVCDETESCTGAQADCPANVFKAAGTACGLATLCDKAPACNGGGACVPGGAVNCDDGNACTADVCYTLFGCQHAPICQDAGTDAGPDSGPRDTNGPDMSLSPEAMPPDMNGMTLLPDAPPASGDARDAAGDGALDSAPPGLDSPEPGGDSRPVTDVAPSAPDAMDSAPEAPPPGVADASKDSTDEGNPPVAKDSGVERPEDQAPPKGPTNIPTPDGGNNLSPPQGGCSCALGVHSASTDGSLPVLAALVMLVFLALRRRTT